MSEITKSLIKYNSRIISKHDISTNWEKAINFIPLKGEIIVYDDLNSIKIGDGINNVNNLPFIKASPSDISNFLGYIKNEQNYPVEIDDNDKIFVNVPWTDTKYYAGTGITLSNENTFNLDLNYVAYQKDNGATGRNGLITPHDKYTIEFSQILREDVLSIKGGQKKPLGLYKFSTTTYGFVKELEPITAEDLNGIEINSSTTGATNSTDKIYIVGAESAGQTTSKTYTNYNAYINNGAIYSEDSKVLTESSLFDGTSGMIKSSLLPSYVDDVIEGYYVPFETTGAFIGTDKTTNIPGEIGKIYVDIETNKTYRWSGSAFIEISSGPLYLGTSETSAFRGDLGQIAYEHATHGNDCINYSTLDLYKIKTENGHIISATKVTKQDILDYDAYTAGTAIVISNGKISLDTGYYASSTRGGLMEIDDFNHLWSIEAGANKYILPAATNSTLGGIIVGDNLSITSDGILSVNYPIADYNNNGLMSINYYTHLIQHKHSFDYTPEADVSFSGNTESTSSSSANQTITTISDSSATHTVTAKYANKQLILTPAALTQLEISLANHTHQFTPSGTVDYKGKTATITSSVGII